MLKNYFTIAVRNLMRFKAYSLINILGLAIGMTCCILILTFIRDEFSVDQFHTKADRIYRVLRETNVGNEKQISLGTSGALHKTLKDEFPEVKTAARLWQWSGQVQYGEKQFRKSIAAIDPAFFEIFDFPFVKGNRESAFQDPSSVVVSESLAKEYFGDEDPIGKVLTIQERHLGGERTITAVIKDPPKNSTLSFKLLVTKMTSEDAHLSWEQWRPQSWRPVRNYMLLKDGTNVRALEAKLQDVIKKYMGDEIAKTTTYHLQPLTRVYLYSKVDYGVNWYSDIKQIYLLGVVACFILAIACMNFMNLTTARSAGRAREVGLRKVIGAHRGQLIGQFLGEAMLMSFLALLLTLGLVELMMPYFANFVGKSHLSFNVFGDILTLVGLVSIMTTVGLLAGSYPAFFLSSFQPIETLKGVMKVSGRWLRKGLVTSQFALSILLMVGMVIIYQQLDFMRSVRLGYNQEQVVIMPIFNVDQKAKSDNDVWLADRYTVVKQALLQNPNISKVSAFRPMLGWGWDLNRKVIVEGHENNDVRLPILEVDEDFIPFFDIEILSGRNFSLDIASDTTQAYILNEAAVKMFGWDDPIGKSFEWRTPRFPNRKGKVIGIVKDFHFASLHTTVKPAALIMLPRFMDYVGVKIQANKIAETMPFLEKTWFQFVPQNYRFQRIFMEEQFGNLYYAEHRLGTMVTTFSGLAIFIASLGLFGLVSYTAEQRRKEIGIRKVLGARASGIVTLLSKDFIALVIVANLIAWPAAYWAANNWLQEFAYRMDITLWPFLLGTFLALTIALGTTSAQAIRAAHTNPVDALRDG